MHPQWLVIIANKNNMIRVLGIILSIVTKFVCCTVDTGIGGVISARVFGSAKCLFLTECILHDVVLAEDNAYIKEIDSRLFYI